MAISQEELMQRLGITLGAPQAAAAQDNIQAQAGNGVQQPQVVGLPPAPAPIKPMPQVMMGGPSKEEQELRKRIERQESQDIDRREGDIQRDRQALGNEANKSSFTKLDLSPLMQLAAVAGANKDVVSMYKAPVDQTKDLRAALEKNQEGLATSQNQFLKNQLDRSSANTMRQQLMQDRLNERIYGQVITGLQKDPILHDLTEKNNNITRIADVAFSPSQDINTTSLHDLQQTVTGALSGLKGTGGVGERAQRYMEDAETTFAKLKQKFGDTNSIPRDEPILRHYMELARDGQKFIQEQTEQRIAALSGGHENITNLPTYKPMLDQEADRIRKTITHPQYMNSAISNAALSPRAGGTAANARPQPMNEEDFIKNYLRIKNGGQ